MKNVKKVIAGVAAVAALIAVPTASAFAESATDNSIIQTVDETAGELLLQTMIIDGYTVDPNVAITETGQVFAVTAEQLAEIHGVNVTINAHGASYDNPSYEGGDNYKKWVYTFTKGDVTQTYTVTFKVLDPEPEPEPEPSEVSLTSLSIDGHDVNLDAALTTDGYVIEVDDPNAVNFGELKWYATNAKEHLVSLTHSTTVTNEDGSITCVYKFTVDRETVAEYKVVFISNSSTDEEVPSAPESVTWNGFAIDLADGADNTFYVCDLDSVDVSSTESGVDGYYVQPGGGSDGTKYEGVLAVYTDDQVKVAEVSVTIIEDESQCEVDDGTTEPGDDGTTDGDDEGDTAEPDDESTEEAASSEEASDEETESESNTLAQTGSVLAGVGVFALLALLGSAVVFVVRKRV